MFVEGRELLTLIYSGSGRIHFTKRISHHLKYVKYMHKKFFRDSEIFRPER